MAETVIEDSRSSAAGVQRPKRRARVNAKRKAALSLDSQDEEIKRKRTFDNFYTFCSFVLEYEEKLASENGEQLPLAPPINNHKMMVSESRNKPPLAAPHSPINSAGESSSSPSSSESSSAGSEASDGGEGAGSPISSTGDGMVEEYTSDDESWNLVTCFCRRPFAGRPMIECSKCETWVHLFCAKIRKDHVPDIYVCPACMKAS